MRSAVIAAAICLPLIGSCFAQTSTAAVTRVETRIPPQPLESALKQFAKLDHIQVLYLAATVDNVRTSGASGYLTADQTLLQLLNGTGLKYRYVDTRVVSIISRGNEPDAKPKVSGARSPPQRHDPTDHTATKAVHESLNRITTPEPPKRKSAGKANVTSLQEVVVTGTHIKGVETAYPIVAMTRSDVLQSGLPTIGDVLRTSPLIFSGGMNPGALEAGPSAFNSGDTGTGVSSANLLGIGPDATLTLIDGRRLSATGEFPSGDLSLIPMVAVQRVEIQTGGSSAIYGSDAVAGVVNIILRRDYNGAETSAYDGWTQGGGDFTQRYSQMFGRTFSRGSVMVAAEFDKSDPLSAAQRPISSAVGAIQDLEQQKKSMSLLLDAHYLLSEALSTHVTGIYTHRTALWSGVEDTVPSRTDEFDSDAGMTYEFGGDRSVGIDLMDGGYNQITYITQLPSMVHQVQAIQNGLFGVNIHGSGTVVDLPTGHLSSAAGASFRRENIDVEGNIRLTSAIASRRVSDAYVELSAPLVTQATSRSGMEALRLDAAGQYSDYSDFGSTKNGMVGIVYTPFRPVKLKATYETSFRAPTLYDLYRPLEVALYPGRVFKGAPTGSEVIYELGGNKDLAPERAHSFTGTLEFSPRFKQIPGQLVASATYYYIRFTERIGTPLINPLTALVTPADQPFVTLNPTIAQQNSAIAAGGGQLVPVLHASYSPASVAAIIENNNQNVSADVIHGVMADVDYKWNTEFGEFTAIWGGTWLNFDQRLLNNSAPEPVSGTVFNPPDFKMRGSIGWRRNSWSATVFVNHVSSEQYVSPGAAPIDIRPWTTFDSQVGYVRNQTNSGLGIRLALSIQNLFNRDPPVVPSAAFFPDQDLRFDPYNTSAVGRMFSVSVTVSW